MRATTALCLLALAAAADACAVGDEASIDVAVRVAAATTRGSVERRAVDPGQLGAAAAELRATSPRDSGAPGSAELLLMGEAGIAGSPAFPSLAGLLLVPLPAKPPEALPFADALLWTVLPKSADLFSTAECLDRNPLCREANPIQPSVEHRVALGAAVSVAAAVGFYKLENRAPFRRDGGAGPTKWWAKLPRWTYAALHVAVAAHNLREAYR